MCGIAGFTGAYNKELLHNMLDSIKHRGPDATASYYCHANGVHLAHSRLSIVDIAGGSQPMSNENDSMFIVFNGEIYNHLELRQELVACGHVFKSNRSDTEVLLHGYEEWGPDLLIKLNGMFSFCIYDKINKSLFLARDRFGEKPLYYAVLANNLVFASELKTILLYKALSIKINKIALAKYFAYGFIPAPYTLYEGINKLSAGYYLLYDLNEAHSSIEQYWKFSICCDDYLVKQDEKELTNELFSLISSAVKRRMVADVPIGVFLSGGIDSATVLACLAQHMPAAKISAFSLGFKEKKFDESNIANKVAQYYGVKHFVEVLTIESAKNIADEVLSLLDEPMSDSSILPTYLLSKFARKNITVALSGDGGDELFAGYAPFRVLKMAQFYNRFFPTPLKKVIKSLVDNLPVSDNYLSLDFKLKRIFRGLEYAENIWNPVWLSPLLIHEIAELLNSPLELEEVYDDAISAWNNSIAEDIVSRTSEFYVKFYLQNGVLTKVDRASMMVGLEVRSPFLDNDVVAFAQRLPPMMKYRKGQTKYILKSTMKNVLPQWLLKRGKQGFSVPLTKWLKEWSWPKTIMGDFNESFVKRLYLEHNKGVKDNRLFLWSWLVLQKHLLNFH